MYITREEKLKNNYRKVEAMYRKNKPTDDIARSVGLSRIDTLDIIQKIFALDMKMGRV